MSKNKKFNLKNIWTMPFLSNVLILFMGIIFVFSLHTIKEIKKLDKKHIQDMKNYELSRGNKSYELPNLKKNTNMANLAGKTIVIDAGHGGFDPGTTSQDGKLIEKDITLKVATYLESYLKETGCNIIMTRTSDKAMENAKNESEDLIKRTEITNKSNADIMISIHVNYSKNPSSQGINNYINTSLGHAEDKKDLSNLILNSISESENWNIGETLTDNIYILKHSNIPSVLVECGFITNLEDKKKLENDFFLQDLSMRIGTGIIKYLNKKK